MLPPAWEMNLGQALEEWSKLQKLGPQWMSVPQAKGVKGMTARTKENGIRRGEPKLRILGARENERHTCQHSDLIHRR
jgi:hypothetical protein